MPELPRFEERESEAISQNVGSATAGRHSFRLLDLAPPPLIFVWPFVEPEGSPPPIVSEDEERILAFSGGDAVAIAIPVIVVSKSPDSGPPVIISSAADEEGSGDGCPSRNDVSASLCFRWPRSMLVSSMCDHSRSICRRVWDWTSANLLSRTRLPRLLRMLNSTLSLTE